MPKLIFPILNSVTTLLPGPSLFLDDKTRVDRLTDEQVGLLHRTPAEYAEKIKPEQKCFILEITEEELVNHEQVANQAASRFRFLFNQFRANDPLILAFAVLIKKNANGKISKEIKVVEIADEISSAEKTRFKFKAGTQRTTLSAYYKVLASSCIKHPRLYLTLSRFNSSLTRRKDMDRIIDITISLESLVQDDKLELSFKFALFNSYASNKDPKNRRTAFDTLKLLYDNRSQIVHGAGDEKKQDKKVSEIMDQWGKLEEIAQNAINYQVLFLKNHEATEWPKHHQNQIIEFNEHPEEV